MAKHRRKRNMRRAEFLMWVCIALTVLSLALMWCECSDFPLTIRWLVCALLELPVLLSAVFFCLYQRGFRPKQLIFLLLVCAYALFQLLYLLYFNCRSIFVTPHLGLYLVEMILSVLTKLSKAAFLLALLVGLKKNDRRILRYGGYLLISMAILLAIGWTVHFRADILSTGRIGNIRRLVTEVCELLVYALIAYRGVATDDIALPGYPSRPARPAAPTGGSASVQTVRFGQAMVRAKSKVASAVGSGGAARRARAARPAPADGLDDLEKLAKLRDSGVLTEEEFQRKKAEILTRI